MLGHQNRITNLWLSKTSETSNIGMDVFYEFFGVSNNKVVQWNILVHIHFFQAPSRRSHY